MQDEKYLTFQLMPLYLLHLSEEAGANDPTEVKVSTTYVTFLKTLLLKLNLTSAIIILTSNLDILLCSRSADFSQLYDSICRHYSDNNVTESQPNFTVHINDGFEICSTHKPNYGIRL
jgi:hypothetical protein